MDTSQIGRTVLAVNEVGFSYQPRQTTLSHVSFAVEAGEMYALLGRNGAGKTTCLEIIQGLRSAHSGTVRLFKGEMAPGKREARLRTGVLLQETGLPPDLTCLEILDLYGRLSDRKDSSDRLIGAVGLSSRARSRVKSLSGGERRRLDFALAIWGSPEFLILDEPTTGMDIDSRLQIWALIDGLRSQGAAVLLTTHYIEEAEKHADRIGILAGGQLQREGSFQDLISDQETRIEFYMPANITPPLSAEFSSAGGYTITTRHTQETLYALLSWADLHRVTLSGLRINTASLEGVLMSTVNQRDELELTEGAST